MCSVFVLAVKYMFDGLRWMEWNDGVGGGFRVHEQNERGGGGGKAVVSNIESYEEKPKQTNRQT